MHGEGSAQGEGVESSGVRSVCVWGGEGGVKTFPTV